MSSEKQWYELVQWQTPILGSENKAEICLILSIAWSYTGFILAFFPMRATQGLRITKFFTWNIYLGLYLLVRKTKTFDRYTVSKQFSISSSYRLKLAFCPPLLPSVTMSWCLLTLAYFLTHFQDLSFLPQQWNILVSNQLFLSTLLLHLSSYSGLWKANLLNIQIQSRCL